jgi:hypothetical protein
VLTTSAITQLEVNRSTEVETYGCGFDVFRRN